LREETANRPLLAGQGPLVERIRHLIEEREGTYSCATMTVDTDDLDVEEVASLIIRTLESDADD
jgi:shikimate kinase